ncbi:MAG: hypothetical protein RI922_1038 [Bacteroidota bacterium]|jgi:hypothetical protein
MEVQLNKEQEQLLALQEKNYFKELTIEEQAFVLSQTTQEAFDQTHFVMIESKELFRVPEARPLVIPVSSPSRFRLIVVPFTSAAASAIITFFFLRKETIVNQTVEKPIYLTADTVYMHDKKVDTVIEYREGKTIYIHEKEIDRPRIELSERVKSNEVLPPLTTLDLKNRGESLREDKLVGIMDGVVY